MITLFLGICASKLTVTIHDERTRLVPTRPAGRPPEPAVPTGHFRTSRKSDLPPLAAPSMAPKEPPVAAFGMLTPYAADKRVKHTGTTRTLAEWKGLPTVIHLYTG